MPARLGRLKRRRDFLRIAAARRRHAAPGLVLQVAPAETPAPSAASELRVGFTASRKVGNAVSRNRVRRRLKAAAAAVLPVHAASGMDYVLIGRRGSLTRPFGLLKRDLETALQRLGAWHEAAVPPAGRGMYERSR